MAQVFTPPLKGQVVLITGAGAGIGAATALELHRRGAVPVLVDCDEATLAITAATLRDRGLPERGQTARGQSEPGRLREPLTITADVTSLSECEAAVARALAVHGRIDVVWANAGIASFGPLAYTDPAAWWRCIEVNVLGVFNTVRAALPEITRRRGFVVVSASVSSFAHPPAVSAYAASKAAVEAMCNSWRIELAAHGVRVGAIHASWVQTPLVSEGGMHPGFRRLRDTAPAPLRRELPVDVAARLIADGIERRSRQIWVPGWVRVLHWLRVLLHTAPGERELLRAAPDIERLFVEGLAASGVAASSFPPREFERSLQRGVAASPAAAVGAGPVSPLDVNSAPGTKPG